MKNKKRLAVLLAAAAAVLLAAGALGYGHYDSVQREQADMEQNLRENVLGVPIVYLPSPTPVPEYIATWGSGIEYEDEGYECPVNFDALWEQNPDVIAWLDLPGTAVSYPILQDPDSDTHYLNVTIDGYQGYPGSIFVYSDVAKDFSDFNTIIYGHNMSNGSMFGTLRNYREQEIFDTCRELDIYTPDAQYRYEIFAAVVYGDERITYTYDFSTTEGREAYLASILQNSDEASHVDPSVTVTTDDHIITLSTCIDGQPQNRYLVTAVLKEIITAEP